MSPKFNKCPHKTRRNRKEKEAYEGGGRHSGYAAINQGDLAPQEAERQEIIFL